MILKPIFGRKPDLSHPICRNMIGLWLFNEGSGSIANDLSGNRNHGTIPSDMGWAVVDTGGPALSCQGGTGVDCGTVPQLAGQSECTVVALAENQNATSNGEYIVSQTNSFDTIYLYWPTNELMTFDASGTDPFLPSYGASISHTSLSWYQWAGVCGRGFNWLYKNSIEQDSTARAGNISASSTENFFIGKNWAFRIHYVYLWNRALFEYEISWLLKYPYGMFPRLM